MTEKMKPSGIAWIGDVPQSWKISRLKYNVTCLDERRIPVDAALRNPGPYPYWGAGSIVDYVDNYIFDEELVLLGEDGAPFFDKYRPVAFLIAEKIWANNHIHVIKGKPGICNRFLVHYLNSVEYREYINGSILNKLTQGNMNEIVCPIPSDVEQEAIADFLDSQCAKIDGVIADIEKQIEILQKYKKSLITEAVTKGLDRSAPMKDSGIEWIGKIPAHWATNRLRYVASVKTGPFGTQLSADEYVDEGVPIINVKNIGYGSILAEDLDFVPESVADRLSVHRLKLDDIVFGRKGAVDKHAIITNEYVNWVQGSDCIRVRSNPEINSGYLNYLFDSTYFGSYVMLYAVGATMPSMSSDILLNARILVPPVQEQRDIAAYLNKQCGKINAIITNKQAQLDTIRSHKKSLIYEYVTGKKRVTEVN
jgi:type I restriction enzyme S subunit